MSDSTSEYLDLVDDSGEVIVDTSKECPHGYCGKEYNVRVRVASRDDMDCGQLTSLFDRAESVHKHKAAHDSIIVYVKT